MAPNPRLAVAAFVALLPGFFAYHFLLAKALIPAWFGGYSTAMALLWVVPLGLLFARSVALRPGARSGVDTGFMAFLAYMLLVMLLHLALAPLGDAATEQIGVLPQFIVLYIVARLLPPQTPGLRGFLIMALLAMSTAIVTNADEGTFFAASFELLSTADHFANYQAYGFVYTVCLLYVLCTTPSGLARLAIYAFALPTLFLNGARTELVGVLLLTVVLEFAMSRHKWLVLAISGAVALGVAALLPVLLDLYPESRTLFLFLDYSEDISKLERDRMLADGWRSIVESPWVGALGSHKPGEHIHNALSAWMDLGLVGFAAYALLLIVPLVDLLLIRKIELRNVDYRLALSFVCLMALFALVAKHYTHQLLPLALGTYARFAVTQRQHMARPLWTRPA